MRSDQARFQWSVHEALHYAERAIKYVGDQNIAEFSRNSMAVDAVVRCIEVIGEAAVRAKKASPEIYAQHKELMFDELRDARNAAIHEYERVDPEDLFVTIDEMIRPLASACHGFLGDDRNSKILRLVTRLMHEHRLSVSDDFVKYLEMHADDTQVDALLFDLEAPESLEEMIERHGVVVPESRGNNWIPPCGSGP